MDGVKMNNCESHEVSTFENSALGTNTKGTLWSLQLAVFVIVLFFAQIFLQKRRKKQDKNLVKWEDLRGPIELPIIGSIWILVPMEKTLYTVLNLAKKFGSCFRVRLFNEKFVLLNSPELAQSFLKSGDLGHVLKSPLIYDLMTPFVGNGVLVSKGTFWKSERKILSRFMFMSNIKEYFPMLQKHTNRFVTTLETLSKDGQPILINDPVNTSFLEIITELLTGADMHGTQTGLEYHHNFEMWKTSSAYRLVNPWLLVNLLWKLHPLQKKQSKAVADMMQFSQQRLDECKEKRRNESQSSTKFQTMIDALLDADVPDRQIIDELNTMMFGGHDTSAGTIQFFFLLMALNPHHQELCRSEVDHAFDATNGQLNYESLFDLNYVERCVLETLRMFPIVFGFGRKIESPLNIEYNNKTLSLEPGTNIGVLPWLIQRNPEYYPNPDVFDPDRFLPHESAKRHTHAFLPFSAGPRNCLGMKFAMMQLKLVAAHVLHKFEVMTMEKMENIVLLPLITLVPHKEVRFIFKNLR